MKERTEETSCIYSVRKGKIVLTETKEQQNLAVGHYGREC